MSPRSQTTDLLFKFFDGLMLGADHCQWILVRHRNSWTQTDWKTVSFVASNKLTLLRVLGKKQIKPDEATQQLINLKKNAWFNLEALKLGEQPIFFVEGEKDVDTLRRHNLFAVTSGSTSSWRNDFAHLFAGHDIKIVPDNDAAGRKFAAQVMAALKPVAATVGIISLPDMPEKGDVSDYLTTHCVEEFLALESGHVG